MVLIAGESNETEENEQASNERWHCGPSDKRRIFAQRVKRTAQRARPQTHRMQRQEPNCTRHYKECKQDENKGQEVQATISAIDGGEIIDQACEPAWRRRNNSPQESIKSAHRSARHRMPLDHIQMRKRAEENYQCEHYIELMWVEAYAETRRQKVGRSGLANPREDDTAFVAPASVTKQSGESLARIDPDRPQC